MSNEIQKITIAPNESVYRHDTHTTIEHTEYYLEQNSSLVFIHEWYLEETINFNNTMHFFLQPGSSLKYVPVIKGGKTVTLNITVTLFGNSHAHVTGAYALKAQQHYFINTRQEHRGKKATSILKINGTAADQSVMHYQGTIAIEHEASDTNASQENKTILLSDEAKAISIPALEVKTNEVQCAHGSAIGPLSSQSLWYAQSRGISIEKARYLLLAGFFGNTLEVSDHDLKTDLIHQMILPLKDV